MKSLYSFGWMLKWQLVILLVSGTGLAFGQNYDSAYLNRLYYTCKVWGFAKYHHTRIAKGEVDWDNVLLEQLTAIKRARDNASFNQALLNMLNQAGEMGMSAATLPDIPDSLNNAKDISWMKDPVFSRDVATILDTIRARFRPQNSVYVDVMLDPQGVPTLSFTHDGFYYEGAAYPLENVRILGLFRYWNTINYFYPYKNLMDKNWDLIFKENAPKIVYADDALAYNLAFREFTVNINDSHSFLISPTFQPWYGEIYPPFSVRHIEGEMVVYRALPGTGLSPGDIVKKMDGVEMAVLRDSLRKYAQGSNQCNIDRVIEDIIIKGPEGPFSVTVTNGIEEKTLTLERDSLNLSLLSTKVTPVWQTRSGRNGCNFGYVYMPGLTVEDVPAMFNDLWGADAIIFDLRGYPQMTLLPLVNHLFRAPLHMANFLSPDPTYPGRLFWHQFYIGEGTDNPYPGKIIILFNERTLSLAEFTCMGLDLFPGAVKIGSTTAGADGPNVLTYMPGGIVATATMSGIYYPDYTQTQRIGIIPDYTVLPTIQGIRDGKDEVLEYALNCNLINSKTELVVKEWGRLYPNPATDCLLYEIYANKPALIEIYDLLGSRLKSFRTVQSSGKIDLTGLPQGVYLVSIVMDHGHQIIKIMKD